MSDPDPRGTQKAQNALARGALLPFDGSASYWTQGKLPRPAEDWAHAAARGVIADLSTRPGLDRVLTSAELDLVEREDIIHSLANIIRLAAENRDD
jgi:hypothetical protein